MGENDACSNAGRKSWSFVSFSYICICRSGRRGWEGEREALGLVPGLLIDGCRIQAGRAGNAEPRDAAKSIPVRNHSQIPDMGTLVGWSWGLFLSWCCAFPSASPEPGQSVPAEEHFRNLPLGFQRCGGRRYCPRNALSCLLACWASVLWLGTVSR